VLKNLGHGQFGTVYLVTNEQRSCEYALKCVQKSMILENRLEKHLQVIALINSEREDRVIAN
jgi:serine/threonine protein kinase